KYTDEIPLLPDQDNLFHYRFENINDPFSYQITVGKDKSAAYKVNVIDLPAVRELQLTVTPPRYTRLGSQKLDPNVGNISVLPGTRVDVSVAVNKPVASAYLVFNQSDSLPLTPASGQYQAHFTAKQPGEYFFRLQDQRGLLNANPIVYQIKMIPDQSPTVEFTYPARDIDIDESMQVTLALVGEDDYGFSRLRLLCTIYRGGPYPAREEKTFKISYQAKHGKLVANYQWDLTALNLLPEDVVVYQAELFDNDYISGPKSAKTPTFRLRFPSVQEIFAEAAQDQEAAESSFEQMLDKSQEIKRSVDEILNEARRKPELNWEEKQKLKQNSEEQQKILNKLEEVKKKIDEMVDRMQRNDLLTLETIKKYQELQNLLDEVATPELKKMMKKLQDALKNMDQRQVQKALEDFQFSQEEFLKSIERTIN
ncbi:MAG: hypothetical protein D6814_17555, partial [Calditrichaeota bacterium]